MAGRRYRAVLFDVGGPLDTEERHEAMVEQTLCETLRLLGRPVADGAYAAACRRAVEQFAPNAYQAALWQLAGADRALCEAAWARITAALDDHDLFDPRPGMAALLGALVERGLRLGLAANQPTATLARLDRAGFGRFFAWREVSGSLGLRKPDPRLLIAAAEGLRVAPAECIMIGDRIDNDVVPAKTVGMATVLLRTGLHADQAPRSWLEIPDHDAGTVEALTATLENMMAAES